jgi:putative oxidoreductase
MALRFTPSGFARLLASVSSASGTGGAALAQWAPLPLRLIVGFGFFAHGYAKLSRGPASFAAVLDTLGIPVPHLLAWLTTAVELIGGAAVIAGAFVALASIPLAVILLTALFTIHVHYGFFSVKLIEVTAMGTRFGTVGYEIILLYLAGLGVLAAGGAGSLSIDRGLAGRRGRRPRPGRA